MAFRLRLRTALVVVALVAVMLGVVAETRRQERSRILAAQHRRLREECKRRLSDQNYVLIMKKIEYEKAMSPWVETLYRSHRRPLDMTPAVRKEIIESYEHERRKLKALTDEVDRHDRLAREYAARWW
jgi:hypothetical protein